MTTIGFKDLSYADTTVSGIVTATALNVRSGPATTYSVIGQVLQGNDIKIVDKTGNWLKVNYKNTTGYVSGAYVSSIYNEAKTEGYVIGCNTLNVRSGPGTEYARKGSLVNGTKVHIISTSLGWSKIIYNGNYAYRQVICRTHQAKTKETQEVITLVMGIICQTEVQKTTIHKLLLKIQVQLLPIVLM